MKKLTAFLLAGVVVAGGIVPSYAQSENSRSISQEQSARQRRLARANGAQTNERAATPLSRNYVLTLTVKDGDKTREFSQTIGRARFTAASQIMPVNDKAPSIADNGRLAGISIQGLLFEENEMLTLEYELSGMIPLVFPNSNNVSVEYMSEGVVGKIFFRAGEEKQIFATAERSYSVRISPASDSPVLSTLTPDLVASKQNRQIILERKIAGETQTTSILAGGKRYEINLPSENLMFSGAASEEADGVVCLEYQVAQVGKYSLRPISGYLYLKPDTAVALFKDGAVTYSVKTAPAPNPLTPENENIAVRSTQNDKIVLEIKDGESSRTYTNTSANDDVRFSAVIAGEVLSFHGQFKIRENGAGIFDYTLLQKIRTSPGVTNEDKITGAFNLVPGMSYPFLQTGNRVYTLTVSPEEPKK